MNEQASLFEEETPAVAPVARVEFLVGMMTVWALGEGKKPKAHQRVELEKLARRFIADCDMVVKI